MKLQRRNSEISRAARRGRGNYNNHFEWVLRLLNRRKRRYSGISICVCIVSPIIRVLE